MYRPVGDVEAKHSEYQLKSFRIMAWSETTMERERRDRRHKEDVALVGIIVYMRYRVEGILNIYHYRGRPLEKREVLEPIYVRS